MIGAERGYPGWQVPTNFCAVSDAKRNLKGGSTVSDFKVGDHVSWNSEAGRVTGVITKVHSSDFDYKGYTHHASTKEPQFAIKSDKSDHVAVHKSSALSKIHGR